MTSMRAMLRRWLSPLLPKKPARKKTTLPAEAMGTTQPSPLVACASVVIPALNEAARIADVVRYALSDPATAEVIVIDDSSVDDTARLARQAGARVYLSSMLGKGASMRDGLGLVAQDIVVYLDGDLSGLQDGIITDLCRPLVHREADFVKARFGRGGGRVTELTAKPMLKVFFPELAHIAQPLGGIIAARRTLLNSMHFEDAYGVDVGLLIDAQRLGAKIVEVDVGSLEHDSQPLLDLTAMANEISRVIYSRARTAGRLHVEQIVSMYESQRQATASVDYIITRRRDRRRLLLLDMDGTVTPDRFVTRLAEATNRREALDGLLDGALLDDATRSQRIAEVFKFVHRHQFEQAAHALTLRPGAIEWVNQMRRAGFMVGLVSDSYFVAAEIVRRRLFADFAVAHTVQFTADACNGELRLNPAFMPAGGSSDGSAGPPSKGHVLERFRGPPEQPLFDEIWAVGDNLNDLPMLMAADRAFAIFPKTAALLGIDGVQVAESFDQLKALTCVEEEAGEPA